MIPLANSVPFRLNVETQNVHLVDVFCKSVFWASIAGIKLVTLQRPVWRCNQWERMTQIQIDRYKCLLSSQVKTVHTDTLQTSRSSAIYFTYQFLLQKCSKWLFQDIIIWKFPGDRKTGLRPSSIILSLHFSSFNLVIHPLYSIPSGKFWPLTLFKILLQTKNYRIIVYWFI